MKTPKEFKKLSKNQNWAPCGICGGMMEQIRTARFQCKKCLTEYIACEEDMRP